MSSSTKSYKIVRNAQLGRYLSAIRDIMPGESIIDEPPLVTGPVAVTPKSHQDICPSCCSAIQDIKSEPEITEKTLEIRTFTCQKCNLAFCSPFCSSASIHTQNECIVFPRIQNFLKQLNHKVLYNLIQTVRCLFHRVHSPQLKWAQVMQLESNVKALEKVGIFEDFIQVFEALKWEYFIDNNDTLSEGFRKILIQEDIVTAAKHCLGSMRTNSFSSFTPTHARESLYFLSSLMSHSCVANSDRQIDQEGRMVTITAKNIDKGEAITTSYLHPLGGTWERFMETGRSWLFVCKCERCMDPYECGSNLSTVGCPNCSSLSVMPHLTLSSVEEGPSTGQYRIKWKCKAVELGTCSFESEDAIPSTLATALEHFSTYCGIELDSAKNIMLQLNEMNLSKVEEWMEQNEYDKLIHPNHAIVSQIKFLLCQYYGRGAALSQLSMKRLHNKVNFCRHSLGVFNFILDGIFMPRGVALFEYWNALREIQRRRTVLEIPFDIEIFKEIDSSSSFVSCIRTQAFDILKYGITNSVEESMGQIMMESV